MGIQHLMQLLREKAPNCFKQLMLDFYAGRFDNITKHSRTIGCDASMAMYQFLIQLQSYTDKSIVELKDKDGNKTAHLVGLFNRTIQFMENGIKPVWVFDGKPPKLKSGELAKRRQAKEQAKDKTETALETGNMEQALMQNQRNIYITKVMRDDAVKMLQLMGCPVIEAPCEAEAMCAALCKSGKLYATATDDMDALTFQTPVLLKGFNTKKEPIYEINYDDMLKELELTYPQFVDLCILCGCDYTEKIEGIGPATAYKLIKEHKDIESILIFVEKENIKKVFLVIYPKQKYKIPEKFYYLDSRELFMHPHVTDPTTIELIWNKPDEEGLKRFLVDEKGFAETRVENGLKKIKSKDSKGVQPRLENFFGKSTKVSTNIEKKTDKKDKKKGGKGTQKRRS